MSNPRVIECVSCDASFKVQHEMIEHYYTVEYCPFCGEELELEEELEITYDEDEENET